MATGTCGARPRCSGSMVPARRISLPAISSGPSRPALARAPAPPAVALALPVVVLGAVVAGGVAGQAPGQRPAAAVPDTHGADAAIAMPPRAGRTRSRWSQDAGRQSLPTSASGRVGEALERRPRLPRTASGGGRLAQRGDGAGGLPRRPPGLRPVLSGRILVEAPWVPAAAACSLDRCRAPAVRPASACRRHRRDRAMRGQACQSSGRRFRPGDACEPAGPTCSGIPRERWRGWTAPHSAIRSSTPASTPSPRLDPGHRDVAEVPPVGWHGTVRCLRSCARRRSRTSIRPRPGPSGGPADGSQCGTSAASDRLRPARCSASRRRGCAGSCWTTSREVLAKEAGRAGRSEAAPAVDQGRREPCSRPARIVTRPDDHQAVPTSPSTPVHRGLRLRGRPAARAARRRGHKWARGAQAAPPISARLPRRTRLPRPRCAGERAAGAVLAVAFPDRVGGLPVAPSHLRSKSAPSHFAGSSQCPAACHSRPSRRVRGPLHRPLQRLLRAPRGAHRLPSARSRRRTAGQASAASDTHPQWSGRRSRPARVAVSATADVSGTGARGRARAVRRAYPCATGGRHCGDLRRRAWRGRTARTARGRPRSIRPSMSTSATLA
jgi:hypothetical protein